MLEYWSNGVMEQWVGSGLYSSTPSPLYSRSQPIIAMARAQEASRLVADLSPVPGVRLKLDEPLARYTSMKIGGPADYFIEADHGAALAQVLIALRRHQVRFCLLGNGSNVLISDRGVRGAVIHLTGEFKRIEWRDGGDVIEVEAGAAYPVTRLARQAARKGYAGL